MQVADMIKEMQSVTILQPSPLSGGLFSGRFFIDYSVGPFKDSAEVQDWFNHKLDICKRVNQYPKVSHHFNSASLSLLITTQVLET